MIYFYSRLSAQQVRQFGLDESDPDIEWITVKGNHIPIKPGQSKEEAVNAFFESKGKQESGTTAQKAKTIKINGVERPTLNAGGAKISESEESIKNFWRWFGDSKVVDDKGRPQVVYHGTKDKFSEFKKEGNRYDSGYLGAGFYFTNSRESAGNYSAWKSGKGQQKVMKVYLQIKNPLVLNSTNKPFLESVLNALGMPFDGKTYKVNEELSNKITKKPKRKVLTA